MTPTELATNLSDPDGRIVTFLRSLPAGDYTLFMTVRQRDPKTIAILGPGEITLVS